METKKIQTFQDLFAWQEGHKLVLLIYRATKAFPKEELFGLTSQVRRAAVSITSNIAEGFSRKSAKEKNQFYHVSQGSLIEVYNQMIIAHDIHYISDEEFETFKIQLENAHRLLQGLITKTKSFHT